MRATMYLARKDKNNLMKAFGMSNRNKVFVEEVGIEITLKSSKSYDKDYFLRIINESKNGDEFWVPAIEFAGEVFIDNEIKEISDGKRVVFVNKQRG